MTPQYVAIVEKDPDSAFGVWFPDVEGCFSAGDTLAEAAANAAAALRQHVEALESAGRPVPSARALDEVREDADVSEALAAGALLIAVPLLSDAGRTVRINVSLDKGLVDQIDDAASARGLTRSAFLAQAAREKIAGAA
ncbi:type II toxin-antitoxin system HicB family antitoxin [Rhodoplanes sp. TEM]|uniref:Type II toxin-antitoxin system HicB family antitoxin n=1 Tax=Rhodoplanes tepidamans TaxID=200616 RepID=A0ABT5J5S7_RHOTP|nr:MULTISPECIES: type II toxin-antitoxin system HicB family antitoxin [Rhodoplanes]MDC7785007.1 type II toxin-antitoxin system HicB family antitoxin [Rhodoplanes tepidamans]MDC7986698.1 type II toxin-antitoxin system HicB family antitoxin [Rhodoplanes sp. TEM]MDQ0353761.1 putative RNase H-like HicB family nuclease [Rhodoplanes tepidamans]